MLLKALRPLKIVLMSSLLSVAGSGVDGLIAQAKATTAKPAAPLAIPLAVSTEPAGKQAETLPVLSAPSVPTAAPAVSAPPTRPLPVSLPAAVPPTAVTTPLASSPVSSDYTLGAGDIVRIDIFQVPQYSSESQVLTDGTLNLPLVGKVDVSGLSLDAASEVIAARYAGFLRRPLTTLSLVSRRPLQVGIAGEVSRPGSYTVAQDTTQFSRLSQLIETAGGITQSADLSQVQIRRAEGNGSERVLSVNLWDLIANGNINQDIVLQNGDSIYIPTAIVPLDNAALLADASFASEVNQPINVAIIGEVYRPGPYTLQGGAALTGNAGTPGATTSNAANTPTTVTRAIQTAGGIKPLADIRKVQVLRPTRSGVPQVFEVDLWQLLQAGDLKQDAILQAGDTVFVPVATTPSPEETSQLASASFSPDTIRVNVVGEVEQAGTVQLPPNTPLSQAILAAGGFNTRASQGSAELVRLNDNGTVERVEIPVDFAQGISEENNPLLRNNDVVIVNRSGLAAASDVIGTILSPLGGLFRLLNLF